MLKTAQARSPRFYLKKLLSEYSYWLSFIMLLILGQAFNPNFFRWTNISNIFVQSAPTGIIALGMTMVICAGQIDISVGSQVAIISGLSILVLNATSNIWVTLLFCLLLGLFIGTFTGVLVSKGHMPAMIATLAVQTARSPWRIRPITRRSAWWRRGISRCSGSRFPTR
jgi:ribose transport system permease protein